jgi:predicted ATPase
MSGWSFMHPAELIGGHEPVSSKQTRGFVVRLRGIVQIIWTNILSDLNKGLAAIMIQQLALKNFKTFRNATVNFGPVSIVLGSNGAGKSNLFDALRFLKSIGDGRSVRDAVEGHISPGGSTTATAGIRGGSAAVTHFLGDSDEFELDVTMKVPRGRLRYYVKVDAKRYRILQEELSSPQHPGQYVYSTRPKTGVLKQDPESPVVIARFHKGTQGLNPRREFSSHEFILSQFVSRRAESRVNEAFAVAAREEFSSIRPLELRPEVLRQYSPLGRFELGEHGENFAAVVWRLEQDSRRLITRRVRDENGELTRVTGPDTQALDRFQAISAWLSELTPRPIVSIDAIQSPTGEAIFAVREEPYEKAIPAPSLSDGTLRFAALTLAAIGARGRSTLVIEEIENGINPTRLSLLIKMLEQAAELPPKSQEAETRVQVIASTHSPSILDYASRRTIRDSVVIGWDHDHMSSHPVGISDLPDFSKIATNRTLGELQAEGWLQVAADV